MIFTDHIQLETLYDSKAASLSSSFLHFFHTTYSPISPHCFRLKDSSCTNSLVCLYHLETKFKTTCNTQVLSTAKTPSTVPTASSQPAIADVKLGQFFPSASLGIYLHWILLFRHAAIQYHRNTLSLFFLGASCHIGAWQATNLLVFI